MGNQQGGGQHGGLAQGHDTAYDLSASIVYHYDTVVNSKSKQESLQNVRVTGRP